MTLGMSHLISKPWWGVNIISKFQHPNTYGLGGKVIRRSGGKG